MVNDKFLIILVIIFLFIGGYIYTINTSGEIEPLGRLAFVKFHDPDMYPGNYHSTLLAQYAEDRNSKCALVVHFAGNSSYRHYREGNVTILQLAFIDKKGATTTIDWGEVVNSFLFGIPDDRWKFRADGIEFNTLDEALNYIYSLAEERGQVGSIPMVYHGTVRAGDPLINQGDGFPLYYYITWEKYGRIAAYYYFIQGALFPFFNLPTWRYELQHASELQRLYNTGKLSTSD
ncbi:hypothetical protein [Methanobacterium oryzae]|uniref:hypothetical protein n=1 Tax=Methanobacterium oryzae TaxID=69540 RepID=UPI003D256DC8